MNRGRKNLVLTKTGTPAVDKALTELHEALVQKTYEDNQPKPKAVVAFGADEVVDAITVYLYPGSGVLASTLERVVIVPAACSVGKLFYHAVNPGTGTGTIAVTLRRNNTDTDLALSLPVAAQTANNRSVYVSFAPGEVVSVSVLTSGTVLTLPENISVGMEFT